MRARHAIRFLSGLRRSRAVGKVSTAAGDVASPKSLRSLQAG